MRLNSNVRLTFEVIFGVIALFAVSYAAYTDGHEAGVKQGRFDVRFECEAAKAAAVDEAVRAVAISDRVKPEMATKAGR